MRTRDGFSEYLQVRGFTGNLVIDHTLATLDMKVKIRGLTERHSIG